MKISIEEQKRNIKRILKDRVSVNTRTIITYLMMGVIGVSVGDTLYAASIATANGANVVSGTPEAPVKIETPGDSVAIGTATVEITDRVGGQVAIGAGTTTKGQNSVAVGPSNEATATGGQTTIIGSKSQATAAQATAIGNDVIAGGYASISIGSDDLGAKEKDNNAKGASAQYATFVYDAALEEVVSNPFIGHLGSTVLSIDPNNDGVTEYSKKAIQIVDKNPATGAAGRQYINVPQLSEAHKAVLEVLNIPSTYKPNNTAYTTIKNQENAGQIILVDGSDSIDEFMIGASKRLDNAGYIGRLLNKFTLEAKIADPTLTDVQAIKKAPEYMLRYAQEMGIDTSRMDITKSGGRTALYNAINGKYYSAYQKTRTTAVGSIAIGGKAQAMAKGSVSLGVASMSRGDESLALGVGTITTGNRAVGMGTLSIASGDRAIAIGTYTNAPDTTKGEMRYDSPRALADDAVAIGSGAYVGLDVAGTKSVALGAGSIVTTGYGDIKENFLTGSWEGILNNYKSYDPNKEPGVNELLKKDQEIPAGGVIPAGAKYRLKDPKDQKDQGEKIATIDTRLNAAVILLSDVMETHKQFTRGTTTTGGTTGTVDKAYVGKLIYRNFAGGTAVGAVSVGYANAEKRIQNVAAGEISPTSTDAVNGSQLYIASHEISKEIENTFFHINDGTGTQKLGDTNTNRGKIAESAGARGDYTVTAGINTRAVGVASSSVGYDALSGMIDGRYQEMKAIDKDIADATEKYNTAVDSVVALEKEIAYAEEQIDKIDKELETYQKNSIDLDSKIAVVTNADEKIRLIEQRQKLVSSEKALNLQRTQFVEKIAIKQKELEANKTIVTTEKPKIDERKTALKEFVKKYSKDAAVATGAQAEASGKFSVAVGKNTTSVGDNSTTVGQNSIAGISREDQNNLDVAIVEYRGIEVEYETKQKEIEELDARKNEATLEKETAMKKKVEAEALPASDDTRNSKIAEAQAEIDRAVAKETKADADKRAAELKAGELNTKLTDARNEINRVTGEIETKIKNNSVAVGNKAFSSGESSVSVGDFVNAKGEAAISIGKNTAAIGENSISMGQNAVSGIAKEEQEKINKAFNSYEEVKAQYEAAIAKKSDAVVAKKEFESEKLLAELEKENAEKIKARAEARKVAADANKTRAEQEKARAEQEKTAAEQEKIAADAMQDGDSTKAQKVEEARLKIVAADNKIRYATENITLYTAKVAAAESDITEASANITVAEAKINELVGKIQAEDQKILDAPAEIATLKIELDSKKSDVNNAINVANSKIKNNTIAIGNEAVASGEASISIGKGNIVSGDYSGAFGDPSVNAGKASYTFGNDNVVGSTSEKVFVLGSNNQIGATGNEYNDGKLVIKPATADKSSVENTITTTNAVTNSVAIGNNNYINSSNTYILGSGVGMKADNQTELSTVENSVYLGNDSTIPAGNGIGTKNVTSEGIDGNTTTAGATGEVSKASITRDDGLKIEYGNFAGATADGAISVGSAGKERRIMNVAAGEISKTSTDAINGSQLYAVAEKAGLPIKITANKNIDTVNVDKGYKAEDGLEKTLGETFYIKGANDSKITAVSTDAAVDSPYSAKNIQTIVNDDGVQIQFANKPEFEEIKVKNNDNNTTIKPTEIKVGDKNDTNNGAGTPISITANNGTNTIDGLTNNLPVTSNIINGQTKNMQAPTDATINNNAATVGDILNAGWNLKEKGADKDFVRAYDTVNFIDGNATTVTVTNTDGKTSNIKYDVKVDGTTIKVNDAGNLEALVKAPETTNLTDANTDGKIDDPATGDVNKFVTAENIANAINAAAWKTNAEATGTGSVDGTSSETDINAGDKVNFVAGNNLKIKQEVNGITTKYTYSLNPELKELKSAEFKNGDNVTNITPTGTTITNGTNTTTVGPTSIKVGAKAGDVNNPVTITSGDNGGTISNLTTTLPDNANNTSGTAPTNNPSTTNASTLGDVLNSGWNLKADGADVDFVKTYDTVDFVGGKGINISKDNDQDKTSSTLTLDLDLTDTNIKTDLTVSTGATTQNNNTPVGKVETPSTTETTKLVNAGDIAEAINNSGFTLKTGAVTNVGSNNTTDTTLKDKGELVNPGDVVTMIAGKNMVVEHTADGNITYSTKDDVEFKTVKVGETGTNGDTKQPVTLQTENATPATNNETGKEPTTALKIESTDGKPTQITGVGSTLNTKDVTTKPAGTETPANNPASKLVDLVGDNTNTVNPNSAATVGDLQNMGWVVKATGNEYSDVVKNANEVNFVGTTLAKVTGKTENNVRTITVDVNAQNVTNKAQLPVEYTTADGTKVYPVVDEQGNITKFTTNPDGTGNDVAKGDVITSVNGPNGTTTPTTLTNVKGNLDPTYNVGDKQEVNGKLGDTVANTSTPEKAAPQDIKSIYNNTATVGDVLNAGWNLQENGTAKDFVKPYDTVNFINGTGTTVKVENTDGKISNVKINTLLSPTNAAGDMLVKGDNGNWYKAGDVVNGKPVQNAEVQTPTTVKVVNPADETVTNPIKLGNVATSLKTKEVKVDTDGNKPNGLVEGRDNLLNLENSQDNPVNSNSAATVGDLQNMGWVVSARGNSYTDVVKNANEVEFVGDGISVTGETDPVSKKRVITIKPNSNIIAQLENELKKNADGATTNTPTGAIKLADGSDAGGFATAGNLMTMINQSGWNLKENGTQKDLINPADEVDFVNGTGTTVNVTTDAAGKVSTIKVNVDKGTLTNDESGKVVDPVNDSKTLTTNIENAKKALEAAEKTLTDADNTNNKTPDEIAALKEALVNAEKAANDAGLNKVATAQDVANAINNSGFTLKADKTDGENKTADTLKNGELINPGDVITMQAGKNMVVEHTESGKITYSTKDDVEFKTVEIGEKGSEYQTKGENPKEVVKVNDKFYDKEQYDALTPGQDGTKDVTGLTEIKAENVELKDPSVKLTETAGRETKETKVDGTEKVKEAPTALSVKDSNGNNSQINGVASALDTKDYKTAPTGKDGEKITSTLIDIPTIESVIEKLKEFEKTLDPNLTPEQKAAKLEEKAGQLAKEASDLASNVVTVGDVAKMGWIVEAEKNGYVDTVKNANRVNFVGTGLATVTGETKDGVRTITVDVNAQRTVEAADTPVIYTDEAGNKLVKGEDGKFYPAGSLDNLVFNEKDKKYYPAGTTFNDQGVPNNNADGTTPTEVTTLTPKTDVIASMNDGDNKADSPKTLANVAGNLPDTYSSTKDKNGADTTPTTEQTVPNKFDPDHADFNKTALNNAATVGDVLNAGWNLKANDENVDFVKPYDTVKFQDGAGTLVSHSTDGKESIIQIDIDNGTITPDETTGKVTGPLTGDKTADELIKDIVDAETALRDAQEALDNAPDNEKAEKQKLVDAANEKVVEAYDAADVAGLNKVATAQNVADAINKSGFTLKADKTTGDNITVETLKDGELINPGDVVTMKAGKNMVVEHTTDGNITYSTKDNVEFNTVTVGDKVDEDGNKLVRVGDKYYKEADVTDGKPNVNATPVENDKVKDGPAVKLDADKGLATTHTDKDGTPTTTTDVPTALSVKDKDGNNSQINGVASSLDTKEIATKPLTKDANGTAVADKQTGKDTLVDLSKVNAPVPENATPEQKAAAEKLASSVITAKDAANMGWVIGTSGNEYVDTVKNANKVDFVGENGITVTGSTKEDGTREIKVSLKEGEVVKSNEFTITDKDGNNPVEAIKVGDNYYNKADIDPTTGNPIPGKNPIDTTNKTVENKGDNFVTGNAVADAIQKSGFTVGKQQNSDGIVFNNRDEKVNPNDNLRFVDGEGTIVSIGTVKNIDENGTIVTNTVVKVDVDKELITLVKEPDPVTGDPTGRVAGSETVREFVKELAKEDPTIDYTTKTSAEIKEIAKEKLEKAKEDNKDAINTAKENLATKETEYNIISEEINTAKNELEKLRKELAEIPADQTAAKEAKNNEITAKQNEINAKMEALNTKLEEVKTANDAVTKAEEPVKNIEKVITSYNKLVTTENVVEAINNSGFKLKADKTEGENLTADTLKEGELINPGDTVTMQAGKNMVVEHTKDGNITYSTKDDVEFNTVTVGDKVDEDGNKLVKVGDKYYKEADLENGVPKVDATPVEKEKVKDGPAVVFDADKGLATTHTDKDGTAKTTDAPTALSVKDKDGNNSQINGVASSLDTKEVETKPLTKDDKGNVVADKQTGKDTLVDLSKVNVSENATPEEKAAAEKLASSAVTVGDIAKMGWIVEASENSYKDTVKNANTVKFIGDGGISVTGKTNVDGVREVTIGFKEDGLVKKGEILSENGVAKETDNIEKLEELVTKQLNLLNAEKPRLEIIINDPNSTPEERKAAEDRLKELNDNLDNANKQLSEIRDKVTTVGAVVDAINKSGFNLTTSANGGTKDKASTEKELINPGETVDMVAGKNMVVKQEANGRITYSTADDVNFTSVTSTDKEGNTTVLTGNGLTITPAGVDTTINPEKVVSVTAGGINAGGNRITNVAPGEAPTDAVNVAQLKDEIGGVKGDLGKNVKGLRGGIAGVAAMANIPQINDAASNRYNVAVGTGHYKGENAVAVGFSGVSDGGRVIYKATAAYNSEDDVILGLGAGYQFGKRDIEPNELDRLKAKLSLVTKTKDDEIKNLKNKVDESQGTIQELLKRMEALEKRVK